MSSLSWLHAPLTVLLALGTPASGTAQAGTAPLTVPRTTAAVTIDGRLDAGEWDAAHRAEGPAGTAIRLQRDATHLYLAITSPRSGFASLCLGLPGAVHILHASAALGAISYRESDDRWRSPDEAFTWAMRNTALDDAARHERDAYLREHGWVASTMSMGDGRTQEMQLALDRFPLPMRIALARWLEGNTFERWPAALPAEEGCATPALVSGRVVQGLQFEAGSWVGVE